MNTSVKQASARRYLWLVVLISLPAISWWGVLDDFSSEHLNASTSSAGLVYGTAWGINALVSLLQGTEFKSDPRTNLLETIHAEIAAMTSENWQLKRARLLEVLKMEGVLKQVGTSAT